MAAIEDHPLRYQLANELHARPFPTIPVPGTVAYLAVKQPSEAVHRDRMADLQHLKDLLERCSHHPPHSPGGCHDAHGRGGARHRGLG